LITSSACALVSPIFKTVTFGEESWDSFLHYMAEIDGQFRFLLILSMLYKVAQNSKQPRLGVYGTIENKRKQD